MYKFSSQTCTVAVNLQKLEKGYKNQSQIYYPGSINESLQDKQC